MYAYEIRGLVGLGSSYVEKILSHSLLKVSLFIDLGYVETDIDDKKSYYNVISIFCLLSVFYPCINSHFSGFIIYWTWTEKKSICFHVSFFPWHACA